MVLVSLELGGLLNNPRMPFMRWGSHISIIAILVTMFVIPHDQSTRMRPDQVGSDALRANSQCLAEILFLGRASVNK